MDGPIDELLTTAMKRGATDVHFNGAENTADIYIRIHGELVRIDQIPHATYKKMTRALYVAGQGHDAKDWSEDHYLDTSIERTIDGKRCRIRFSQRNAYPNTWDVSLRIYQLGQEAAQVSFNELGFEPHQIELMRFMLDQPKGAVLLVGPMNSGKSTTLKSMLEYLVDRHGMRAKIQTLENPVEYHIAGVRQSSVSARASNTEDDGRVWSRALSAMMRSDAQILMLGEIRDPETAAFAQELTATGHKLLATLHARNPFEAIERLLMSGLRREVIAGGGFLTGIVNLHLLPCICSRCAKTFAAVADSLPARLRKGLEAAADTYGDLSALRFRGDGCDACQHLGTTGRTPVAEFLIPDEAVNESIRMDRRDIAEKAFADGSAGIPASIPVPYRTLLDHALTKAFRGVVDPVDVDVQVGAIIAPSKPQQPLRSIAGGQ